MSANFMSPDQLLIICEAKVKLHSLKKSLLTCGFLNLNEPEKKSVENFTVI